MNAGDPPEEPTAADASTVREAYDRIAGHFSQTREYPWPEVETFLDSGDDGDLGVDLGCGNGRHSEVLAEYAERVIGIDVSVGLLTAARERAIERGFGVELVQGDAERVPLADDCASVAVYVATLHHLPTRDARVSSLDELARILSPGGRALVSAWSTEHDRFDADDGFDTYVDWTLPGGKTIPRFYHIYSPDEFDDDLAESDLTVDRSFVSSGNCYAEVTGR